MVKKEILILGAGISGLVAARALIRSGFEVGIVEARDRTGGRILSLHQHGLTAEAGPEFIHGHLRETIALLNEYKIPYIQASGKMYFGEAGHFTTEQQAVDHWDLLLRAMKGVKNDMPFLSFLQEHFADEEYRELRESAIRFATGFDLADVKTVSTMSLIEEWAEEENEQYRIPSGYGRLTAALTAEFLASGGEIFFNEQVFHIEWAKNKVVVSATNGVYEGSKVLVTLPAGVLNHEATGQYSVLFSPEIPAKRTALSNIGFGTVIKIILYWKTAFWKTFAPDLQFILSKQEIPTWWTQNPEETAVLVGWLGGPPADRYAGSSPEEIRDMALNNLCSIFDMPQRELNENLCDVKIFNWRTDPYTRGAYSFDLAGHERARSVWRIPLEETLYFAGEVCYRGPHGGTVEAAIATGLESAREMIRSVNLSAGGRSA